MSPRGLRRFPTSPSGTRVLATFGRETGFSLDRFSDEEEEEEVRLANEDIVDEEMEDLRFGVVFFSGQI